MPISVPIRDMKNTADFAALVEREGDVTVTKNGYTAIHCLSDEAYQMQAEQAARAKLLSRMMLAEEEIEHGEYDDYRDFSAKMRDEYDL